MKKNLSIILYSILFLILTNCSKNKDKPGPPPGRSLLTGRVVEYGSGSPLGGVNFSYNKCIQFDFLSCSKYSSENISSNTDGSIIIPSESITGINLQFDSYIFSKNGYWNNASGSAINLDPSYPIIHYFTGTSGHIDSFQVQLFPIVNMKIHAKNTNITPAGSLVDLQCQANFSAGSPPRGANLLFLRSGIDTTFDFPVFGNVENSLYIFDFTSTSADTLYTHTQFITRGDSVHLEVLY